MLSRKIGLTSNVARELSQSEGGSSFHGREERPFRRTPDSETEGVMSVYVWFRDLHVHCAVCTDG